MLLKTFEVIQEWVDYNNHMNMAYYVLVFDQAWEVALEKFKMGGTAAKDLNRSTMVVETNTKYLNEVKEGEKVNEDEFIEDFLPKIVCSDSNCEVVDKSGNVKGYISNQELQSSLTRS